MTATPLTNSSKDGMVTAIGVLVLVIGTATGSALVMLAMSIVALAVVAIFYRSTLGRASVWLTLVAAATVATVCVVMATFFSTA